MAFKLYTEIVNGCCPTNRIHYGWNYTIILQMCYMWQDLQQHINGKISYIPTMQNPKNMTKYFEELKDG